MLTCGGAVVGWGAIVGWMAVGCADRPVDPADVELLAPTDRLLRASMALRGIRPSLAELEAVRADPAQLEALVDGYLASPEFGETIKDLHAELYSLRTDTANELPVVGPLYELGYDQGVVHDSSVEAPLRFVEDIVMSDRPYTEILTAQYTLADAVVADIYGLPYDREAARLDPEHATWQRTTWTDGRPLAGLLSDSQVWRRHVSNTTNFHRGRANFVARTFLCEDVASRDVVLQGTIDINDPLAVAEAVNTQETCVGCHAVLDPMAAFFWGYKEQLMRGAILTAYDAGCEGHFGPDDPIRRTYDYEHFCYPLRYYSALDADRWEYFGLRPPAFFGQEAESMTDLGELVVEDPRFAPCVARSFYAYFGQVERDGVPIEVVSELQDVLLDSDWSAKELARAIVLHESFQAMRASPLKRAGSEVFVAGLQTVRPEQLARTIEDLTGFRWLADQDGPACDDGRVNDCWGTVELTTSNVFGFRSMAGGDDGDAITWPTHTTTPMKLLTMRQLADEAAGFVVDADWRADPGERRLLAGVERETVEQSAVRAQLSWLHERILGEVATEPTVDASFGLWSAVHARSGSTEVAWKVLISTLLQDVRMAYY